MDKERFGFSAYEYLTFLIPGAVLGFTAFYGWNGWPYGEPGAGSIIGIAFGSFIIGHFIAAFSNWLESFWWGKLPGQRVSSVQGLFGKGGVFSQPDEESIRKLLADQYPQLHDLQAQFTAAYVGAQAGPLSRKLQAFVEQIGFYRSMAAVSLLSAAMLAIFGALGREHLPGQLWLPIFTIGTVLFAVRYRRFWRRVGEYVIDLALSQQT